MLLLYENVSYVHTGNFNLCMCDFKSVSFKRSVDFGLSKNVEFLQGSKMEGEEQQNLYVFTVPY